MIALRTSRFELGHQFKAREARDNWKDVLDEAEGGVVAVLRRNEPVVAVARSLFDELIESHARLDVKASVGADQVAFWLEELPVHGAGPDMDSAEEAFLDALVDYADLWFSELRFAPNHQKNRFFALRIAAFAGDRSELRRLVFGAE